MGSTGSGSFSDYHDYKNSGKTSDNGGGSGEDQCAKAFSTYLEEVAVSEYYKKSGEVPPEGTEVIVKLEGRLAVSIDETIVGYLPTEYNFLRGCMSDGFAYSGVIVKSTNTPIPSVMVDIVPNHE